MGCEGCTACCTVMAVDSLGKPMYTACANEGDSCCAIYDKRPMDCRAFSCAYVADGFQKLFGLTERDRPDNSGMILFPVDDPKHGPMVAVWDVTPGAHESYQNRRLLKRLSRKHLLRISDRVDVQFIGRPTGG